MRKCSTVPTVITGNDPMLEVIVPTYKKADSIVRCIQRIEDELTKSNINYQIHVILDGPDSDTSSALSALNHQNIRITVLSRNYGKGFAVRHGIAKSSGKFVGFIDADLDIHPVSLVHGVSVLQSANEQKLSCAYGSKFHRDSLVEYPKMRRAASWLYKVLVRVLFQLDVEDSQTGVKVFNGEIIRNSANYSSENGFLFDLEIFAIMSKLGFVFVSVPVELEYQYSSTIGLKAVFKMVFGTIVLALKLKTKNNRMIARELVEKV
jgi:glycosyltransferase involved in cell wall biosynthesis